MDFGELSNDTELRSKVANITDALTTINRTIDATVEFANYEDLSTEEKVKYDLYMSYAVNSLYWTYCKVQGMDVNTVSLEAICLLLYILDDWIHILKDVFSITQHGIKNEISRVRTAMVRDKQLLEHRTVRPVLDAKAAGRFIRHGLWEAKPKNAEEPMGEVAQQRAQKRKHED